MLEHLFGSKTRVKLISLFLNEPDEPVFVREITRRIGTQINAVRRELANLAAFGFILETEGAGADDAPKRPGLKRKYYQLSATYPLLPEIRALMTKAQVLVEHRVDKELEQLPNVRYAALMGAFLGQAAPVDLFIVGEVNGDALRRIVEKLEKGLAQDVNYSVMSVQEFTYRKDMMDKFLYRILETPKSVIVDKLLDDSAKH